MEKCTKIFLLTSAAIILNAAISQQQYLNGNNILDVEQPKVYLFNPSPLRNRDSLRQQPYYNFLNTLYRHDRSKANLFDVPPQNLHRQKRSDETENNRRNKRGIVFRPLFVYRQQEVKKQRLAEERRRRYKH